MLAQHFQQFGGNSDQYIALEQQKTQHLIWVETQLWIRERCIVHVYEYLSSNAMCYNVLLFGSVKNTRLTEKYIKEAAISALNFPFINVDSNKSFLMLHQVLTQESLASLMTGMMAQTGSLGQPLLIPLSMAGSIGGQGGLAVLTLPTTNVATLPGLAAANAAGNLLKLPFAGLQGKAKTVCGSAQLHALK